MTQSTNHDGVKNDKILRIDQFHSIPIKKGKLVTSDFRECSDDYICQLYLFLKNAGIKITESFLYGISGPKRKVLKIPFCNGVKASSLNYFFFNSPNLEIVDLSNCYQVNNRVIKCIISNCKKLRELNICGCKLVTDSAFYTELFSPVESCMTNLRMLNIEGCSQIVDLQSIIKHTRDLEVLNISYCRNITISTLEDIIQSCTNLKELDISSCDGINDNKYEFNCYTSTNIEKMSISRSKLSGPTLEMIIFSMENLKYLNLNYCVNVDDQVFGKISSKLTRLNTLSLRSCAKISDSSFCNLGEHLRELEHLDISWCPRLTSRSLKYLALRHSGKTVSKLKTLKLSQNTNMASFLETDDCFTEMVSNYRKKIPRLCLDDQNDISCYELGSCQTFKAASQSKKSNFFEPESNILQDEVLEDRIAKLIKNEHVKTRLVGGGLTPLSMCLLIKYNSESLIELELEGLRNVITCDVLEHIGMLCTNLKSLKISIFENDDLCVDSFDKICKQCTNLHSLSLDITHIESKRHHSSIIDCIPSDGSLCNLKELSILFNPRIGITDKNLDLLSSCKFQLSKLELKNFRGFSSNYIKENILNFKQLFSSVLEVSLSGNDIADDDDIILILKSIEAPCSIELINFNNVSANLPKYIWEHLQAIKRLSVLNSKTKVLLERLN